MSKDTGETTEAEVWTLGYEAAGSDDAAWTLRYGIGSDTVIYEATGDIAEHDDNKAQEWADDQVARRGDVVEEWRAHYRGRGTSPDYYTAALAGPEPA